MNTGINWLISIIINISFVKETLEVIGIDINKGKSKPCIG